MKYCCSIVIALITAVAIAPLAMAGSFPTWSDQIRGSGRFKALIDFGNAAVLDKETGLVWERSPSAATFNQSSAILHCNQLTVGGRLGWRLPGAQELATLYDPGNAGGNPDLPAGHPFAGVVSAEYWSATYSTDFANSDAWIVDFSGANGVVTHFLKSDTFHAWCVRGGPGLDVQ